VDGKAPEFVAFWVKEGRVLAGMNVLVRAGYASRTVDLKGLADPAVPLSEL
jgi:3-phenylpropionate/trans-cinnamate dioxygenase ferredoxin reductase component